MNRQILQKTKSFENSTWNVSKIEKFKNYAEKFLKNSKSFKNCTEKCFKELNVLRNVPTFF